MLSISDIGKFGSLAVLLLLFVVVSSVADAKSTLMLWGKGNTTRVAPWGYQTEDDETKFYLRIGKNVHAVHDCKTQEKFWELLGDSRGSLLEIDLKAAVARHNYRTAPNDTVEQSVDLSCDPTNYAGLNPDRTAYIEADKVFYLPSGKPDEFYKIPASCAYELTLNVFKSSRANRQKGIPPSGAMIIELSCAETVSTDRSYRLFGVEWISASGETVLELAVGARRTAQDHWTAIRFCSVDGMPLAAAPAEKVSKLVAKLRHDFSVSSPMSPLPTSRTHLDRDCLDACIDGCANPTVDAASALQLTAADGLELLSLGDKRDIWLSNCRAFSEKYTGLRIGRVGPDVWRDSLERFELYFGTDNPRDDKRVFRCPSRICRGTLQKSTYQRDELDALIRGYAIEADAVGDPACRKEGDGTVAAPLELTIDRAVTITATDEFITIGNRDPENPFTDVILRGEGQAQTLTLEFKCKSDASQNCPSTAPSRSFFEVGSNRRLTLRNLNIQLGKDWEPEDSQVAQMRAFVARNQGKLVLDEISFDTEKSVQTGIQVSSSSTVYCRNCAIAGKNAGVRFEGEGQIAIVGSGNGRSSVSSEGTAIVVGNKATAFVSHADVSGRTLVIVPAGQSFDANATTFTLKSAAAEKHAFTVRRNNSQVGQLSISCRGPRQTCTINGFERGSDFSFLEGAGVVTIDPLVTFLENNVDIRVEALGEYLTCSADPPGGALGTVHYRGQQFCR